MPFMITKINVSTPLVIVSVFESLVALFA